MRGAQIPPPPHGFVLTSVALFSVFPLKTLFGAGGGRRGRIPLLDTALYQDKFRKKVLLLTSVSRCLTQCPAHSSDSPAVELRVLN